MGAIGIHSKSNSQQFTGWKPFFLFLFFALLLHICILSIPLPENLSSHSTPVEIQTIAPSKLEAVRRQWKEKSLLLAPEQDSKKLHQAPPQAPKDARYFSDRNIKVEKEQRALNTSVVPQPGTQAQPSDQSDNTPSSVPGGVRDLRNLGIPFSLKAFEDTSFSNPTQSPSKDRSPSSTNQDPPQRSLAGSAQALLENDLPIGSQNLLNAQESVYYSFYARLYEAIGPVWNRLIHRAASRQTPLPGEYTTVLDVVLDEEGNLREIKIIRGSGIADFDEAAMQAWQQLGQFPNPPPGLLNAQREIHTGWTFRLDIGEGFRFSSPPPRRVY